MIPIQKWESSSDTYVFSILPNSTELFCLLSSGVLRRIPNFSSSNAFEDISLTTDKQVIPSITHDAKHSLIYSCSNSGIISGWDYSRTKTSTMKFFSKQTKFSSIDVGLDGILLACSTDEGIESKILFYDVRNQKEPIGCFTESFSDSVTTVKFHPDGIPFLISGSDDGLLCIFDLTKSSESLSLNTVFNSNSAVAKIGYFGGTFQGIYSTTCTETLSLFEFQNNTCIVSHDYNLLLGTGCRETLQQLSGQEINYLIDCIWESRTQRLLLCAGNINGEAYGFEVTVDSFRPLGPLSGGHQDVVRCCAGLGLGTELGFGIVTGGEDGRICLWRSPD